MEIQLLGERLLCSLIFATPPLWVLSGWRAKRKNTVNTYGLLSAAFLSFVAFILIFGCDGGFGDPNMQPLPSISPLGKPPMQRRIISLAAAALISFDALHLFWFSSKELRKLPISYRLQSLFDAIFGSHTSNVLSTSNCVWLASFVCVTWASFLLSTDLMDLLRVSSLSKPMPSQIISTVTNGTWRYILRQTFEFIFTRIGAFWRILYTLYLSMRQVNCGIFMALAVSARLPILSESQPTYSVSVLSFPSISSLFFLVAQSSISKGQTPIPTTKLSIYQTLTSIKFSFSAIIKLLSVYITRCISHISQLFVRVFRLVGKLFWVSSIFRLWASPTTPIVTSGVYDQFPDVQKDKKMSFDGALVAPDIHPLGSISGYSPARFLLADNSVSGIGSDNSCGMSLSKEAYKSINGETVVSDGIGDTIDSMFVEEEQEEEESRLMTSVAETRSIFFNADFIFIVIFALDMIIRTFSNMYTPHSETIRRMYYEQDWKGFSSGMRRTVKKFCQPSPDPKTPLILELTDASGGMQGLSGGPVLYLDSDGDIGNQFYVLKEGDYRLRRINSSQLTLVPSDTISSDPANLPNDHRHTTGSVSSSSEINNAQQIKKAPANIAPKRHNPKPQRRRIRRA